MHNYTKIKDLHSRIITSLPNLYASFQSSPKINRILITRSFPYNESRHDSYPQFPRSSLGLRGLQTRSDKKKRPHFKSLALLRYARLITVAQKKKSCRKKKSWQKESGREKNKSCRKRKVVPIEQSCQKKSRASLCTAAPLLKKKSERSNAPFRFF